MIPSPISKLDFALDSARRGLRLYPLAPNSEEPAFPQANCFATDEGSQILEWWGEDPSRNIGLTTDDALVIRITERCLPDKVKAFGALLAANSVPLTCRIVHSELDSPRLEIFLFYKSPPDTTVAGKRNAFGPGIDLLSSEDVVLGPGSTLPEPGKCEFHGHSSIAEANPWLIKMCGIELPPESKAMNNVVPLKKAATPDDARKTKLDGRSMPLNTSRCTHCAGTSTLAWMLPRKNE
jgi:hypothetical protein